MSKQKPVRTKCDTVTSVYKFDVVEVVAAETDGTFVYQIENVTSSGECSPVQMTVVYTKDGNYVGNEQRAKQLVGMGITDYIQPLQDGRTCCIGYNPVENKWYGWSHRAIFGFGVGSTVKRGDCAYNPSDKADFEEYWKKFWDIDVERPCGERDNDKCVSRLLEVTHDDTDWESDQGNGSLGIKLVIETQFKNGRVPLKSTLFYPYPDVWGRGEWMARTMEDAQQMAIDFANSVN